MVTKIRLDVNRWSYQDFVDYITAFQTGKREVMFPLCEKLIASWDYSIPLQEGALEELPLVEHGKVLSTIFETVQQYAEDVDISDVSVDFGSWNAKKFYEFDDSKRAKTLDKAITMLFQIATLEGASPDQELTMEQGIKMFKAVNEEYRKIITGKN